MNSIIYISTFFKNVLLAFNSAYWQSITFKSCCYIYLKDSNSQFRTWQRMPCRVVIVFIGKVNKCWFYTSFRFIICICKQERNVTLYCARYCKEWLKCLSCVDIGNFVRLWLSLTETWNLFQISISFQKIMDSFLQVDSF